MSVVTQPGQQQSFAQMDVRRHARAPGPPGSIPGVNQSELDQSAVAAT